MQIELLGVRQQSHKEAKWEKPLATKSTEGDQWSMRQFREFISVWRAKQEQRGLKECSGLYICSCIREQFSVCVPCGRKSAKSKVPWAEYQTGQWWKGHQAIFGRFTSGAEWQYWDNKMIQEVRFVQVREKKIMISHKQQLKHKRDQFSPVIWKWFLYL